MIKNILIIILLTITIAFAGCVQHNAKGNSTISLQEGEHVFYVGGHPGWTNEASSVGEGIENFSSSHNVTRIDMQYDDDNRLTGAYIIYRS